MPVLGAGRRCWCWRCQLAARVVEAECSWQCAWARRCSVLAPASDSGVITTAASDNEVPAAMGRMKLCAQHHTVLSLERSLSISAVGYLHSSGSVLADSCVKGRTVCAHAYFCTYNV